MNKVFKITVMLVDLLGLFSCHMYKKCTKCETCAKLQRFYKMYMLFTSRGSTSYKVSLSDVVVRFLFEIKFYSNSEHSAVHFDSEMLIILNNSLKTGKLQENST